MVHIFCAQEPSKDTFTFAFTAGPSLKFSFDGKAPVLSNRPFKRRRALSDVDGGGNEGRKKRRLRLHLITSRLSLPFSQPASNINLATRGRCVSRISGSAKRTRPAGRNMLRKAAIMNRVRERMDAAKDFMRQHQERSRETLALREIAVHKPRYHDLPLPPSPLGLSNYDALDGEDDGSLGDDEWDDTSSIYSDFNILNSSTNEGDDYDWIDALDGITPQDLQDEPPPCPPLDDTVVEMLRDKERQQDGLFINLGA